MDASKYDRNIELNCPVCANIDFDGLDEVEDDSRLIKCTNCGKELTKAELIEQNGEKISANVEEVKEEIFSDIQKKFRDAFRGNKFITFK